LNNLTLGLAVLGGLVLAGVVAHGAWQQRRNAPRVARPEAERHQEGAAARIEPGLDNQALADGEQAAASVEPDFDSSLMQLGSAPIDKKPPLDALIDAIARITLDEPVSGDAALAAMPPTRRVGSKSFAIEGLDASQSWESPRAGQRYMAFQAGVQLASRTGALNEIEFSEFVQKAQTFADTLGGVAEFPQMTDEVARARELDQFASSHDAQLSFTLRAKTVAWSTGYVHQHAARQGFVAGSVPGRMVLAAAAQGVPPILVLSFDTQAALSEDPEQSALRSLDLALDVAHVDRSEQPYLRLREVATALADAMDGIITDGQGNAISRDAMDAIGADLEHLYDTLESRDLAAGSPQARRLFS
jgi:hypothetical protein